jgi:5-methylcytosine-specific restriction enzyme A
MCNRPATVVDHIEPHRGDTGRFWDKANHQPLCKPCHDGAKQSEERTGQVRGCDESGQPLDPGHHWR